jgi:hypothetical protein
MFDFDSEPRVSPPSAVKSRFTFDTSVSDTFVQDLTAKRNKLHGRIQTLMSEFQLAGHPLIQWIFKTIPDPDPAELKGMGEALIRIAELWPVYKELSQQIDFVDYARAHPEVAELAFQDRSFDIDQGFAKLMEENNGS